MYIYIYADAARYTRPGHRKRDLDNFDYILEIGCFGPMRRFYDEKFKNSRLKCLRAHVQRLKNTILTTNTTSCRK